MLVSILLYPKGMYDSGTRTDAIRYWYADAGWIFAQHFCNRLGAAYHTLRVRRHPSSIGWELTSRFRFLISLERTRRTRPRARRRA